MSDRADRTQRCRSQKISRISPKVDHNGKVVVESSFKGVETINSTLNARPYPNFGSPDMSLAPPEDDMGNSRSVPKNPEHPQAPPPPAPFFQPV